MHLCSYVLDIFCFQFISNGFMDLKGRVFNLHCKDVRGDVLRHMRVEQGHTEVDDNCAYIHQTRLK